LQDQYYDLKKIREMAMGANEDAAVAAQSLIEGEATVLMYDAWMRSLRSLLGGAALSKAKANFDLRSFAIDSMLAFSKRVKTDDGAPAIFMEDILFPYVWGGSFLQYTVNNKGWEAVDSLYKDIPVSSEQIMHPEKYYIVRDAPQTVALPDLSGALGRGWKLLETGVFGEFNYYLIGKNFLDELSAKMLSEGWGGDSYAFYEEESTKATLLVTLTKWDSDNDAAEFFSLYKKTLEQKYKQPNLAKEGKDFICWSALDGSRVYLAKTKDGVLLIEGANEALTDSLAGVFTAQTL
jgi:hypothetical protein